MKKTINRLREKKVVLTPQRIAVLEVIRNNCTHMTAEDVYLQLKKIYPTISQATVYTSLEKLEEVGEIQSLTIRKDRVCYDPKPEPHPHLYCERCGKIIDIDMKCPMIKRDKIEGHTVREFRMYLYGICKYCANKHKKAGRGKK